MKQPYLKVNPANHFTKDPFSYRHPIFNDNKAPSNKSFITGEQGKTQNRVTKNDALVLHDFFGALNY